jgi:phage protein D
MKPAFRVQVNGTDITAKLTDRLVELNITDEAGIKSDRLELTVDDRDHALPVPPADATIEVWLGYAGQPLSYMGRFTFDEVEFKGRPKTMSVRAKAADLTNAFRRPRTRSWDDVTLGAIVGEIAGEHRMQPRVAASLASIRLEHVDQTEESDAAFLTRLAAENGATARPADGALLFLRRGEGRSASGVTLASIRLQPEDLNDWSLVMSERGNYRAVTAYHEDRDTGERVPVTAGEADAADEAYQLRMPHRTASEAERAAAARLAEFGRGKASLALSMPGRPAIFAEVTLELAGFRDPLNGLWLVTRAEHALSRTGYVTKVTSEVGGRVAGDDEDASDDDES